MADTPVFGVRFHPYRPLAVVREPEPEPPAAIRIYRLALELAGLAYAVLADAEAERYFLRDQLDRKSASVPQLIAQGLAVADMAERRALYLRARQAATDCGAILDMLIQRATVPRAALDPARAAVTALLDELVPLITAPPRIW